MYCDEVGEVVIPPCSAGGKRRGVTLYKTMIHNDPKLTEIVEKIVAAVQPTKIYLFGSRARGDNQPDSDYDLAIIYDGEKSKRDVKLEIYKLFDRWDFSMDLPVLTSNELKRYKHVATTLAREVSENGVIVYG